jgi:hypothetical protein
MSSDARRASLIGGGAWAGPVAAVATLSAVVSAVGVAFLVAMFAAFLAGAKEWGQSLGWINDVLVMASYLLAVPVVVAFHLRLRVARRAMDLVLGAIGLGSLAAIAVLQWLLVSGSLPFEREVGPVSIALLGFGVWLVAAGALRSRAGSLPGGARMGLLGATYFGYPLWAIWIARRLSATAPQR